MSKKTLKIVVPLAALGVLAISLAACGHRHRCSRMNPEKVDKMVSFHLDDALDDLDATKEQRITMHAVKDRVLIEARLLREKMQQSRQGVIDELKSDNPDSERLHKELDQQIELVREFAHKGLDELLLVHKTLTPEQRAEIEERIQDRWHH
jgi:Spy/CpxP family protein refolding chaperone